jgi:Site-specific recombinase XerD
MINPNNKTKPIYLNIDTIATAFENDTTLRNREPRTSQQYRKIAVDYVSLTGTEQFNPNTEFLDFVRNLSVFLADQQNKRFSYKTLKFHFTALNSFFEYLLFEGHISINPVPHFRERYLTRYKTPEPPKSQQCTPEEISKLIAAAPNSLFRAIIALYASTGMRRQELIDLNVGDVDLERRILIVPDKKKRSNRYIIFADWALDYLLDYLELRLD